MQIKKALQVQAYEHIKAKILNGELEHTQIYSETKIAKELGISRTPMRDAIQHLSQEKYIDIIPNKGFRLHEMELQDFFDTYQIRSAIEGYCAREIAKDFGSDAHKIAITKLEQALKLQNASLSQPESAFFEADCLFHSILVAYVNNKELQELFDNYLYRMRNFAKQSLQSAGRAESAYEEHMEMFVHMKNGNAAKAYETTIFHMESPRTVLIK